MNQEDLATSAEARRGQLPLTYCFRACAKTYREGPANFRNLLLHLGDLAVEAL